MLEKPDKLVRYDPGEYRQRFTFFFWVILVAVCLLVLRLWYLQIIKGEDLLKRSENNRIRIREVKAMRGIILDSRGVVLVENRPSFDVVIFPEDVKDLKGLVEKLETLYAKVNLTFPMDYETILENRRPFTPLRVDRNVSREKLALIETHSLELPGVGIDVMPVREYYYGEMMAHVIGYIGEVSRDDLERDKSAGYKSGDLIGKFGLEKALDPFIRGKAGGEQVEVNVIGKKVKTLGRVEPCTGLPGRPLPGFAGPEGGLDGHGRKGGGRRGSRSPGRVHPRAGEPAGIRPEPVQPGDHARICGRNSPRIPCIPWKTGPLRASIRPVPPTSSSWLRRPWRKGSSRRRRPSTARGISKWGHAPSAAGASRATAG